jgi:hypothetical protein
MGLICFLTPDTYSQSAKLLSALPQKFDTILSEFKINDANKLDPRDTDPTHYTIVDNGINRKILGINCPANISAFSMILQMDRSMSMQQQNLLKPAKDAAIAMVKKLPKNRSECAVLAFSFGNPSTELIHDFSTNTQSLIDSINKIKPFGSTDYNAAFLKDLWNNPGALVVAERAKYKPVIVFLTDGGHDIQTSGVIRTSDIINGAQKINAIVYCITLLGATFDQASVDALQSISQATGGQYYNEISAQDIDNIYNDILQRADAAQYPPPCVIAWEGDCSSGDAVLTYTPWNLSSSNYQFVIPDSVKPSLAILPSTLYYVNVDPTAAPNYKDLTVSVTSAKNVSDITSLTADPRWTIINPAVPISFNKGEAKTITLRYTPTDSACTVSQSLLEGSACSGKDIVLSAGFIFAKDTYVGTEEIDKVLTYEKKQAFCNWTCEPLTITDRKTTGANATEFGIISGAEVGKVVQPGECIDITYSFRPGDVGPRTANIEFKVQGKQATVGEKFTAVLSGDGRGNPRISADKSLNFGVADCQKQSIDSVIIIRNIGGSKLTITGIDIEPDETNFKFKSGKPALPFDIATSGQYRLELTYQPAASGAHTANVKVSSNSDVDNPLNIGLQGRLDTIDLQPQVTELNFGDVCPDELATRILTVRNDGNVQASITAIAVAPYTLPMGTFNIPANGSVDITINLTSTSEGDFNESIAIKDDKCGTQKIVILKSHVEAPAIANALLAITTTVGVAKDGKVFIKNTSGRTITIGQLKINNPQFKIKGTSSNTIAPGDSVEVTVEYAPDQSGEVVTVKLEITGQPCNLIDAVSITIAGNPDKALARLQILDDYKALAGDTVIIPLVLTDKVQYAQTGNQSVSTTISFDPAMLEAVPPYPGNNVPNNTAGTWTLSDLPTSSDNNPQVIANMKFAVKAGSLENCSDLLIDRTLTSSGKGNVTFLFDDGKFCLLGANASVSIDTTLTASPGEEFDLVVYISDALNISPTVHKSLNYTITYNASLFEPVGETTVGTFDQVTKNRKIVFTNQPIPSGIQGKTEIARYRFRAMLGTDDKTVIILSDVGVKNGFVDFAQTDGRFTTAGICESGGKRLFNPYITPGLKTISPNPAGDIVNVEYNLNEEGSSSILLMDMLGNKPDILLEMAKLPGEYRDVFDISKFNSGVYMLILQTPTSKFTVPFCIVR